MNPAKAPLGMVLLLHLLPATAQESQFLFDANGNLTARQAAAIAPPIILSQPQPRTVRPGQPASFSVVTAPSRSLSHQWLLRGTPISGLNGDSFTLLNPSEADEGEVRVILTNPSGSVTSAPAMLWIDRDADGMPDSLELARFGSLHATATGDHDGDGVANADELREGTNPADASSFRPRLNLVSAPYGLGMITASPGGPLHFAPGQVVTLTAAPVRFGGFLGWTGAVSGVKTQISLVMTGHATAIARFGPTMPPTEPPAFESVSPVAGPGNTFSFAWASIPGRRYQLQARSNLNESAWFNLGPPISATDVITSVNESVETNRQRFYRVGLLP